MTENCKLRKAILSAFYNISQRNFGILLILWCSFKLWWNFCLDLLSSKFWLIGEWPITSTFRVKAINSSALTSRRSAFARNVEVLLVFFWQLYPYQSQAFLLPIKVYGKLHPLLIQCYHKRTPKLNFISNIINNS
jgi:hypothetical protein